MWLMYNSKFDKEEGRQDLGELERNESLASQALVYMLRSHFKTLSFNDIGELALEALNEIGLNVSAKVCNQGTSNQKFIENIGVSEEKPYFMFKQRRIFVVYDIPHLLKCVRNNMSNDFLIDGQIITWRAIVNLMCSDTKNKLARAAPKLSKQNAFDKMTMKLTAQLKETSSNNNFRLTLRSIILLREELNNEDITLRSSSKFVFGNKLRQRCGYRRNPSAQQFRQSL
ncbi:hypothetical protein PR048_005319 [Dryococelus australis]|uniref:Transposase n=1 Tax=Dryococelus australis TaxID=614101 RepID=A0ABQ9I7V8_9NEOP|nr:hypothetical protein PR048_005319 [Dryococelus australis]